METARPSLASEYTLPREDYSNEIGEAGEKAIRGLLPKILSDLGHELFYIKPHHVNDNGPDVDGVFKGSFKRIVVEVSNFRPGSYIILDRVIQMEEDAGSADYKVHIISFDSCYNPETREYLESHGWHVISLDCQIMTEKYYSILQEYGHPIIRAGCEDHLLIEPLHRGLEAIFCLPIYESATGASYLATSHFLGPLDVGAGPFCFDAVDPLIACLYIRLTAFLDQTMPLISDGRMKNDDILPNSRNPKEKCFCARMP